MPPQTTPQKIVPATIIETPHDVRMAFVGTVVRCLACGTLFRIDEPATVAGIAYQRASSPSLFAFISAPVVPVAYVNCPTCETSIRIEGTEDSHDIVKGVASEAAE